MAGSPQPAQQPPQQPPSKPRLLCPVMSYATQQVPCVEHHCAMWLTRDGRCSFAGVNDKIDEGFERLIRAINEVKAKI